MIVLKWLYTVKLCYCSPIHIFKLAHAFFCFLYVYLKLWIISSCVLQSQHIVVSWMTDTLLLYTKVIFESFVLPTAVLPCPAPIPSIGTPPDFQCLSFQMLQVLIGALFQLSFYLKIFPSCSPYLVPDLFHQCPWLLSISVTSVTTGS